MILLWVVFAALAAEYRLVERRPTAGPPVVPARPRFLPLRAQDMREVRLVRGGRVVVSRRNAGGWTVVEPAGAPVAPDLIAAFANALGEAEEIERVGNADADPRAYGLDEGAARVEVVPEAGEPVVVTLGGANPTGTAVYARRREAPDVVLIGRNVGYYEDLIFQALSAGRVPAADRDAPVGG